MKAFQRFNTGLDGGEVSQLNYVDAIDYIHSLEKFGIHPGLERIKALCEALGNPQDRLKFIHVAGTNGKGSTSTMISEILQKAGYRTGLFTSPYVIDFNERIQIDGKMIPSDDLAEIVSKLEPVITELARQGLQTTEFEAITAAAFLYFESCGCDVVVLEVGLGGRFDATNIIKTPLASVIASISLDHMAVLGDTIEKIAVEKCGIIKQNGITVCYPEQTAEALAVINSTAKQRNNELVVPLVKDIKLIDESIYGTNAVMDGLKIFIPFMGHHMVMNASVAAATARVLARKGYAIGDENIVQGIGASKMSARMEIISKEPLTILDGGHNEGCANALANVVRSFLKGRRIIAVCGMMADKDYKKYLSITAPLFDTVIATRPVIARALDAKVLAENAGLFCKNSFAVEDAGDAFVKAVSLANANDVIIICGSFYLASELRKSIIDLSNSNKN
jgi:dihydrofolate synthase / folylpolyglutamate synthase